MTGKDMFGTIKIKTAKNESEISEINKLLFFMIYSLYIFYHKKQKIVNSLKLYFQFICVFSKAEKSFLFFKNNNLIKIGQKLKKIKENSLKKKKNY